MVASNQSFSSFFSLLKELINSYSDTNSENFYENQYLCVSVFRGLLLVNKNLIIRSLFTGMKYKSITNSNKLEEFYPNTDRGKVEEAVNELRNMKIIIPLNDVNYIEIKDVEDSNNFQFNVFFFDNIRSCVVGNIDIVDRHASIDENQSNVLLPSKHKKDNGFIETYSRQRWSVLLCFIAGCGKTGSVENISKELLSILLLAGILILEDNDKLKPDTNTVSNVRITSYGFRFLLHSLKDQVLIFLYHLITWLDISKHISIKSSASLISSLSLQTSGRPCPLNTNSGSEGVIIMRMLREVGLIYMRKSTSSSYYVPKTCINIVGSSCDNYQETWEDDAGIIVETNYRLYAYDVTPLQISLIGLFSEILYQFPNLVIGRISRESTHQAFSFGITAAQILSFLESHSKNFRSKLNLPILVNNLIPFSVTDQLRLWEVERNRLMCTEGILYKGFNSASDFEEILSFAQEKKAVVYYNKPKRFIIVTTEGHLEVKRFWKDRK